MSFDLSATSKTSRDAILKRIRQQLDQSQGQSSAHTDSAAVNATAVNAAAVKQHIAQHERGPLPSFAQQEALPHFLTQCERLQTTVASVATMNDVPQAVKRYIDQHLNSQINGLVLWSTLSHLPWPDAGLMLDANQFRPAQDQDRIGITDCFCAIAETGTVEQHAAQDGCAVARDAHLHRAAEPHCCDDGRCLCARATRAWSATTLYVFCQRPLTHGGY
jgi:L-lactate utilization protein LutC